MGKCLAGTALYWSCLANQVAFFKALSRDTSIFLASCSFFCLLWIYFVSCWFQRIRNFHKISTHCGTMTWANDLQQCDNNSNNNDDDDDDDDDNDCLMIVFDVCVFWFYQTLRIYQIIGQQFLRVLIGSHNSEYPLLFTILRPEPRWRLFQRHFRKTKFERYLKQSYK